MHTISWITFTTILKNDIKECSDVLFIYFLWQMTCAHICLQVYVSLEMHVSTRTKNNNPPLYFLQIKAYYKLRHPAKPWRSEFKPAPSKGVEDLIAYRSDIFSELFLAMLVSVEKWGWTLAKSSAIGKINDDNNGSAAALDEESKQEEPPKRDCKFPSRSSFLNNDSVEWAPPFRVFLLRCM